MEQKQGKRAETRRHQKQERQAPWRRRCGTSSSSNTHRGTPGMQATATAAGAG